MARTSSFVVAEEAAPKAQVVIETIDSIEPEPSHFIAATEDEPVVERHAEDREMADELDAREKQRNSRRRKVRLLVNAMLLALVAGPCFAVATVPSLKARFESFVAHLGTGVQDVKMIANTSGAYDEALEEVGEHGGRVDDASRMLGADPDAVHADPNMTAEMAEFAGEDVVDQGGRQQKLQRLGALMGQRAEIEDRNAE